jgi:AcrR family transcriptional regulator
MAPARRRDDADSSEGPNQTPRARGRPRSAAAHGAILAATVALIRESGYDALAIEAIAERAGVAKTTIYRRWATKELLVAEAIERLVLAVPVPDTGSVEQDVLALMSVTRRMYADPGTASLLPALVAAIARSPRVADAIRSGMTAAWSAAMGTVLRRGIARGALRADADVPLVLELLAGPLFYRFLWLGGPVDEPYVRAVVAAVLERLAP